MHKRGVNDKALAGVLSLSSGGALVDAFSLVGSAPFEIRADEGRLDAAEIIWPYPKLLQALLRSPMPLLPSQSHEWHRRMDLAGQRERANALRSLTWEGAQYCVRYQLRTDDARYVRVEERGRRIAGKDNMPSRVIGMLTNIDSAQEDAERAAYLSAHDDLTGLWNKERFAEGLDYLIALARRSRQSALYLRVQISNLTQINETYGFETGDKLLLGIADRLHDMMRAPDMLARVENASFGLGLYGVKEEDLEALITRLQTILSETPYNSFHGPLYAECNFAATSLADKAQCSFDALSQAHAALEYAAQHGEAGLTLYAPEMKIKPAGMTQDVATAEDILEALNDRRISLAYQPIVDAKTRELHHYECLLRLRTDAGEMVSAGRFIMAAEKLGLIHLLDRRALELASETLRQFPDVELALNVSAGTVKDMETADAYIAALRALGPAVSRVTLELTETVALEDPAMASRFSVEARTLGCEFAIDDFGSGYTTFRNLMAIEADTIKIDGSFIEDISISPYKQTFVRMMVDLAQTFSVKTVAEMVNSHSDADLLKRLGVDYLQGYMFGVPSASPAWRKQAS